MIYFSLFEIYLATLSLIGYFIVVQVFSLFIKTL